MSETTTSTVYAPRINVSGIVLDRQNDGSYTASVRRAQTVAGVISTKASEKWTHQLIEVPWDMRVGQDWLRMFPTRWLPLDS